MHLRRTSIVAKKVNLALCVRNSAIPIVSHPLDTPVYTAPTIPPSLPLDPQAVESRPDPPSRKDATCPIFDGFERAANEDLGVVIQARERLLRRVVAVSASCPDRRLLAFVPRPPGGYDRILPPDHLLFPSRSLPLPKPRAPVQPSLVLRTVRKVGQVGAKRSEAAGDGDRLREADVSMSSCEELVSDVDDDCLKAR